MSRTLDDRRSHWDSIWSTRRPEETSWFEAIPERSAAEIQRCAVGDSRAPDVGLIDVGGGASTLVDVLLDRGFNDLTVLDVSGKALDASRRRLGIRSDSVSWIVADVLAWQPDRTFQIWHDRAVLHFLRTPDEIDAYINLAAG